MPLVGTVFARLCLHPGSDAGGRPRVPRLRTKRARAGGAAIAPRADGGRLHDGAPDVRRRAQRLPRPASCCRRAADRVPAHHSRRAGRSPAPSTATRRVSEGPGRRAAEREDLHDLPSHRRHRIARASGRSRRCAKRGVDFAWQRVFGYPAQSHVRFNHAPHIRAKVECSTCHGNIAQQTRRATKRRSEDGLLRELSPGAQGAGRLFDVSLLSAMMDRRSFIKLTAITGTSARSRAAGVPRTAHPLRAGRGHRARHRDDGSRACARCARPAAV